MPPFAETADVQTRLGRDLTDAEEDLVELLLEAIGDEILEAVGQDSDWADELDEDEKIARAFKGVSIEAVYRVLANPAGAATLQESLGAYSYSQTFREDAGNAGLYLSGPERRRCRKVVHGRNVVSSRMESHVSEAFPFTATDETVIGGE